jgi:hypothetical protein
VTRKFYVTKTIEQTFSFYVNRGKIKNLRVTNIANFVLMNERFVYYYKQENGSSSTVDCPITLDYDTTYGSPSFANTFESDDAVSTNILNVSGNSVKVKPLVSQTGFNFNISVNDVLTIEATLTDYITTSISVDVSVVGITKISNNNSSN